MAAPYASSPRRRTPSSTSCSKSPSAGPLALPHIVDDIDWTLDGAAAGKVARVVTSDEELSRVAILKPEPPCEQRILRTAADVDALRRIELVSLDEHDAEAGQRLAAPAHRRTGPVRA